MSRGTYVAPVLSREGRPRPHPARWTWLRGYSMGAVSDASLAGRFEK